MKKENCLNGGLFIAYEQTYNFDKKLLSVNEVCAYLGLGATKVREMLNSPTSTYTVRVGRRVMANKTLLDEYIDKVSKFQLKM